MEYTHFMCSSDERPMRAEMSCFLLHHWNKSVIYVLDMDIFCVCVCI